MKIMVKIGKVDMFGYNGREHHPEAGDSGRTGELMSTMIQRFSHDPYDDIDFLTVMLPEGRVVELVEFEVEAIHYGDPNVRKHFPAPDLCESCESDEDYSTVEREVPWRGDCRAWLCDGCLENDRLEALEEADRKMGDRSP